MYAKYVAHPGVRCVNVKVLFVTHNLPLNVSISRPSMKALSLPDMIVSFAS